MTWAIVHRVLVIGLASCIARPTAVADEPAAKGERPRMPGRAWYYLKAMKEPRLDLWPGRDPTRTVYRLLWNPSFHDQVAVRLEKTNEGVFLYVVRLSLKEEKYGYVPDRIVSTSRRRVSEALWDRVARQVEKARFWRLPEYKRPKPGKPPVDIADGDFLTVEGRRDGKYHWVIAHSPPGGDFVDLCRMLLFATGTEYRRIWLEYRD